MAPRLFRLLALGIPAAGLAAAAQMLTPPVVVVEPVVAHAQPGSGQVLSAAVPAPPTAAPATPAATPVPPTAAPTAPPPPVVHTPAPTAPPAPPPHSRLVSDDGRLDTGVGVYSDCSGNTALSHAYAAVDTCVGGRTYFVGHNPGVFTPLMAESVGSVITWWDASGAAHRLRVVARRDWYRSNGVPPTVSGAVVAQFQTCLVTDGSEDVILDAVPA